MGTMRRGIVVDGRGSQVRVQFDEHDGALSPWLDVAQPSTIGKQAYRRFKKGEMVRCYIDRKAESGEALYALYTDQNPAPADSDDVAHYVMPDGSVIVWEPGKITATDVGGNTVTMTGGTMCIDGNVVINGTVTIVGDGVTHNGTNIGDTHIHPESIGVKTGGPE